MDEENIIDDDAELTLNTAEDEIIDNDDDEFEEEENILGLDDLKKLGTKNQVHVLTEVILAITRSH